MYKCVKIDSPTEDTVVLGGRTLREIVALMDRLKGMLEVIDISADGESRKALYTKRTQFWANTRENQQWTMQHLTCDLVKVPEQGNPTGRPNWDMYIAHSVMPKGHQRILGKRITSANLGESISRIAYVITPDRDLTADVDKAEKVIASYEARLSHIGEWVRLGLWMEVECGCGRIESFKAREVFKTIPVDRDTSEVVKRLKCKVCGTANVIEVTPLNSRGKWMGPLSYTDYDLIRWNDDPIVWEVRQPEQKPISREDEFYINLGGNGEDPVYVGDGLYVNPDGKLRDY